MDTRFWGPSGWRLLHLISFAAPSLPQKHLHTFFKCLPFVLPCKFCRASLTDYIHADPIPSCASDYAQWMYRIHNRVNGKLREQKLLETPDPDWKDIRKHYGDWMRAPCTTRRMIGWDFLFSVAYTTPCPQVPTSPMPGAPPMKALTTPELRNRWGVITRAERLPYMRRWWNVLPHVLPFPEWRAAWQKVVPVLPSLERGQKAITAWLYAAERNICNQLKEDVPHDSFEGLCTELETFASGCGKSKSARVKTCRSKKSIARHTIKQRRRTTYKLTGGYL
jgi:hypothetical protein